MTEQEQQALRATVLETTVLGFDEGIRTAAAMVRASADHDKFLDLLRQQPQAALDGLATLIEDTTNNNSKPLPEVEA